jgi:uncharacterized coiled-coil DUF342 family protein
VILSGELIQKLLNVDRHMDRLGSEWKAEKLNLTAAAREAVEKLARQIQARAQQLLELAQENEKLLKRHQCVARESLQEIRRGARFLKSARGYRENHPKFIDSRH